MFRSTPSPHLRASRGQGRRRFRGRNIIEFVRIPALALVLACSAGIHAAETLRPDQLVDKVLAEVLAAIRDAQAQGKSRETALAVAKARILPHIDFELMTRLAMGRVWKTASVSQRKDLVAEFGTLITRTYSFAIDAYQGQKAIVEPLQAGPADNDVTVRTRFEKSGTQPVRVDYAMWKSPDGWKVYDIAVEHVSLVLTYRSQFNEEVQRSGIDGLLRVLTQKNRKALEDG